MADRGPYRGDFAERLAALDARRRAAGIGFDEWAVRAGVSRRALQYMLKDGRAFRGKVNALSMALRELEKEQKRAVELFAGSSQ